MRLPLTLTCVLAYALIAPGQSEADAVAGPPECIDGTSAGFCHGPSYCRPSRCIEGECGESEVCRERSFCVEELSCPVTRQTTGTTVQSVTGVCGACAGTCETFMVCVPRTSEDGCGCATPGLHRSDSLPIALFVAALCCGAWKRRRRE